MQRQPTHSWLPQPQHATDAVRPPPPEHPLADLLCPPGRPIAISISISMSMSVAVRLSLAATQKVIYLNMVINLVE